MEFKYIQIPALTDEQHTKIVTSENKAEAVEALKGFIPQASGYWTAWFSNGMFWQIDAGCDGKVVRHTSIESALTAGNPAVDLPTLSTETKAVIVPTGISHELFLEALAISRCDDAAVALIRQRKE